jgi:hypothetical protein
MGLFQRRRRDEDRASRPSRTSEAIPAKARAQIAHALADHTLEGSAGHATFGTSEWDILNGQLAVILTREWGVPGLPSRDIRNVLVGLTDSEILDVVEAWFAATRKIVEALDRSSGEYWAGGSLNDAQARALEERFRSRINDIFDDHDIAWQVVGDRVVPRSSRSMHADVVSPVFALTNGERKYARVEQAYQKALLELKPGGDPADAITDAGTALQLMLEACGAKGNALGPLLADARKRELLGPYDSKLAEGFQAIGDWVSADRSTRGDAHTVRDVNREDAWLAVRVAGALVLRLGAGGKR